MRPMKVFKVDARSNPSITLNEILAKPRNNPKWIDTTTENKIFDEIQNNIRYKRDYILTKKKNIYENY